MRHPVLSVLLFVGWLALNQSVAPGHVVLAALVAFAVPRFTARLAPGAQPLVRRPLAMLRLTARVLVDIVVANFALARRVLGPEARLLSRFVWVPLRVEDPRGIALLATIVSLTPGTISAVVSADRRHLLVHAFDLEDEAALVAAIRRRYEDPLREMLGC